MACLDGALLLADEAGRLLDLAAWIVHAPTPGPRWPGLTTTQSLAVASQFGVTLAIAVGLGLLVGQWVDGQVRTGLLFTLLGVFIGLVSGVSGTVTLYRATLRRSELEWSGDHSKLRPSAPSGSSDPV